MGPLCQHEKELQREFLNLYSLLTQIFGIAGVTVGKVAPEKPMTGHRWFDTNTDPVTRKTFNGSAWVKDIDHV